MNRDSIRQGVNIITLAVMLAVNILANALPLNGQTTREISDRLPILFVPEAYVFGIWGLIYLLLLGFGIYQALPAQRENPRLRAVGWWFAGGNLANAAWIFCFHYNQFALSMVFMLALLAALIVTYLRLEVNRSAVTLREKWLLHIPFSVYLGWITVATVANAAYVLFDARWEGFGAAAETWTVLMLAAAAVITLGMIVTRRDIAYTAVIVWALVGIVIKQSAVQPVALAAGVLTAVIVVALALALLTQRRGGLRPAGA
jgi:hypothetical protein